MNEEVGLIVAKMDQSEGRIDKKTGVARARQVSVLTRMCM